MASGILGRTDLSVADTNTTIYTVPTSKLATVTVNICNRGSTTTLIRLGISTTGTPSASDWILYDHGIDPNNTLEKTGIVMDAGKRIVVSSTNTSTNVVVYGFEE